MNPKPATSDPIASMYEKQATAMLELKENYFESPSLTAVGLVPPKSRKVLEVGCGAGTTLAEIKRRATAAGETCETVGVEIEKAAVERAKANKDIDAIFRLNAETEDFLDYAPESFDCLIMIYVLEHVVNPWAFLRKWLRYVRPGGTAILAVPNFSKLSVLKRVVLQGDFAYESLGIMDWTHLRYFTRISFERLITGAGLTNLHFAAPGKPLGRKQKLVTSLFPSFERFFVNDYFVSAQKLGPTPENYVPFEKHYSL